VRSASWSRSKGALPGSAFRSGRRPLRRRRRGPHSAFARLCGLSRRRDSPDDHWRSRRHDALDDGSAVYRFVLDRDRPGLRPDRARKAGQVVERFDACSGLSLRPGRSLRSRGPRRPGGPHRLRGPALVPAQCGRSYLRHCVRVRTTRSLPPSTMRHAWMTPSGPGIPPAAQATPAPKATPSTATRTQIRVDMPSVNRGETHECVPKGA
jgi:hypothetical protein